MWSIGEGLEKNLQGEGGKQNCPFLRVLAKKRRKEMSVMSALAMLGASLACSLPCHKTG
jgi:hypothetical protein